MKLTKLGHSCVLVETPDRVAIFDPGVWSDMELIDNVQHVDRIAYSHEHPDHFDIDILKSLLKKSPQAHVVCNDSIRAKIEQAGVDATVRPSTQCTVAFDTSHDPRLPMLAAEAPQQTGFHFQRQFTHPGDSNNFDETMKVLAMPFVAPWGIPREAIETVLRLKPQYVLPIHDWFYHEEAKQWLQNILESELSNTGVNVLAYKNGIAHELS